MLLPIGFQQKPIQSIYITDACNCVGYGCTQDQLVFKDLLDKKYVYVTSLQASDIHHDKNMVIVYIDYFLTTNSLVLLIDILRQGRFELDALGQMSTGCKCV